MTVLPGYHHFAGKHWETGSVHNYYAYRGAKAPHTGKPYSEALLLGISGGITMGYFTFLYEGYDPQCNILTRNTFDPLDRLLSRLGVVQNLEHTANAQKAESILLDTLADGAPAIVWADYWSLPYNAVRPDDAMWGAFPIVVFGFDREADQVMIADRADVPLAVSVADLAQARGRIKKDKHRLLTLDFPDPERLASAVRLGITDCVKLFTEAPPKGAATNFGLEAYQFWAKMLTNPKGRASWTKLFPPGLPMYAGLVSAFSFSTLFGKGLEGDGERGAYAAFLDEAAAILQKPGLHQAASLFRASADAWRELSRALLPDQVALFAEARGLLRRRHEAFLTEGGAAVGEMRAIDARLAEIRTSMAQEFPLSEAEVHVVREQIAERLITICELERQAVSALAEATR